MPSVLIVEHECIVVHDIGFARLVYRLEWGEVGSGLESDVRLLNITIYRNVPD